MRRSYRDAMPARMALSDRDLRAMLRIAQPDDVATGPDEPIPWSVLEGLADLIPCDGISFFQLNTDSKSVSATQDRPAEDFGGPLVDDLEQVFWTHYWDSSCAYPDETGDLTSVTTASDFHSQRELHSTPMYVDYTRRFGVEREIMMCLPSPRYRTVRLLLARGPGPDFTDRDRALLTLLRPHLHALYQAGTARPAAPLTSRQEEILRLVADGCTNRLIARRLGLAEPTVRKHLENIFERLRVTSRAAAVSAVFGRQ